MRRLAAHAIGRACGALAILLMAVTVALLTSQQHELFRQQDSRDSVIVAEVLASTSDNDTVRAAIGRTAAGQSGRLQVRLANGDVLGMSSGGPGVVLPVRTASGTDAVVSVVSAPVPLPYLPIAVVVITAAAGTAGAMLLGLRPFRPIERALAMVTAVARNGVGRVQVKGPQEFVDLAEAINATADRTEDLLAKDRKMVADISHRLRTPLTALRLDADAIGPGVAADRVRASVEVLERDVSRIIRCLQPPSSTNATSTCDLAITVAERMSFWSAHAKTQKRPFDVTLTEEPTRVRLSREQIEAVVDTLLANVFQHTPPSAPVAIEAVRHAGWITLVVEDGGPGFADPGDALRRGTSSSGSTGLGLDIARSTVESIGGHIVVERGRLGGARVRLKMAEADREQSPENPRAWRLWSKNRGHPRLW